MSELPRPDSPEAWLTRARSDLALAQAALTVEHVLLEDACFHTQQCAEKAIKALKRKLTKEGVFRQLKEKRWHEKPSDARRRKQRQARRRLRRQLARARARSGH